jgi:hypothetical protein
MRAIRQRSGRPTTEAAEGEKATISVRVSADLKSSLIEAAERHGNSLTAEAEERMAATFRDLRLLDGALDLAYGQQTAAVLRLLAEVIEQTENECHWALSLAGRPGELNADWIGHAYIGDQAIDAMIRALEALRAPGDPSPPSKDTEGQDMVRLAARAGQRAAANVFDAILDPEAAIRGLGRWARPVREALGEELIARIRSAETGPGKTIGDLLKRAED